MHKRTKTNPNRVLSHISQPKRPNDYNMKPVKDVFKFAKFFYDTYSTLSQKLGYYSQMELRKQGTRL